MAGVRMTEQPTTAAGRAQLAVQFVMRVTGKTRQQVLALPLRWFMRIIEEWA